MVMETACQFGLAEVGGDLLVRYPLKAHLEEIDFLKERLMTA